MKKAANRKLNNKVPGRSLLLIETLLGVVAGHLRSLRHYFQVH